ncbi:matrix metalloproteinase [Holotrichia oblita]|uniref:Matrix metalloproteinase n=1 Tax=Holotrichia oblita TaxID=644536 RepID=A0ACB9T3Y2_HOLOL|nr:matrix metalloproteinase [Holotrichia oblita]
MKRYGYLPSDTDTSAALYSEDGLSNVIKDIQKFGALPQTGKLDNATLHLISLPRCGVPDILHKRNKRYIIGSKGWHRRNITYYIANWPHSIGEDKMKKDIKLALATWGKYGRLRFEEVNGPHADIVVAFGREYHGDNFPFDGSGGILAHAFFPHEYAHLAGDVHFDADENWAKEPSDEGTYFYAVALHELGHSLGLAHSSVQTSIMFPYYKNNPEELNLDYDDILGIYELYIRNGPTDDFPYQSETDDNRWGTTKIYDFDTTSQQTDRLHTTPYFSNEDTGTTVGYEEHSEATDDHNKHDTTHDIPATAAPLLPDICQGNFDAISMLRQELFIFKNKYVWRLREKNIIEESYPITIKQMFPTLPNYIDRIDAAYERPDGMIILFAGKTYLYKGDYFWRFNETSKTIDPGYPMDMSRWRGVPSHLDAAITWTDGK